MFEPLLTFVEECVQVLKINPSVRDVLKFGVVSKLRYYDPYRVKLSRTSTGTAATVFTAENFLLLASTGVIKATQRSRRHREGGLKRVRIPTVRETTVLGRAHPSLIPEFLHEYPRKKGDSTIRTEPTLVTFTWVT